MHQISYVQGLDSGSVPGNHQMIARLNALFAAGGAFAGLGYTIMRYAESEANYELILRAPGLSGSEQIYMGARSWRSVASDYYNIALMVATGYDAGQGFYDQPGAAAKSIPAHNRRVDYWITANKQRVAIALRFADIVYSSGYIGKFLPYGRPSQYPYPVFCGGSWDGTAAYRYSNIPSNDFYVRGGGITRAAVRTPAGWIAPHMYPYNSTQYMITSTPIRDTGGHYPLLPIEILDAAYKQDSRTPKNNFGYLDGIYYCTGFGASAGDIVTAGGNDHVLIPSPVSAPGTNDYYAMILD